MPLGEGESDFFSGVTLGLSTTLQSRAPHPGVVGKHKLDALGLLFCFVREEEGTSLALDREGSGGGSRRLWNREKMIKICSIKFSKNK